MFHLDENITAYEWIRIFIVPVQVYQEICFAVHSKK